MREKNDTCPRARPKDWIGSTTPKITTIYDNLIDADAFETASAETGQVELARSDPNFVEYSSAVTAVSTTASETLFSAMFDIASGGVRIASADVEHT